MPLRVGSVVAPMGERHTGNFCAERYGDCPSARVATGSIVDAYFRKEVWRFEMHACLLLQLPRRRLDSPLPFVDKAARKRPSTGKRFIASLDEQDYTVAVGIVGEDYGVGCQSRAWIFIGEHSKIMLGKLRFTGE